MKLSSPIYVLKSKAKALKKSQGIPMSQALNAIAKEEGFTSWSLLMAKSESLLPSSYSEVLGYFNPGDLIIIGARPGKGKTSFTMGLFVQAIEEQRSKSFCFTLAETFKDLAGRIGVYNQEIGHDDKLFELNYTDDICANYIIAKTKNQLQEGSLIVIDYLQLLDEKRSNPPLQEQVEKLKSYAQETGAIIIFLSQVDREIEYKVDKRPRLEDIRLPNPLDLNLINKTILLYRERQQSREVTVTFANKPKHSFDIGWDHQNAKFSDL